MGILLFGTSDSHWSMKQFSITDVLQYVIPICYGLNGLSPHLQKLALYLEYRKIQVPEQIKLH